MLKVCLASSISNFTDVIMKFYLVQNQIFPLLRTRRPRGPANNVGMWATIVPNITPFGKFLSDGDGKTQEESFQQFMDMKGSVEALLFEPEVVNTSKDIMMFLTHCEEDRVSLKISGALLNHLRHVLGEGATIKVVATRFSKGPFGGVLSGREDFTTTFSSKEMNLVHSRETSSAEGKPRYTASDRSIEVDPCFLSEWRAVHELSGGVAIKLNITYTIQNPKPVRVNHGAGITNKILRSAKYSDLLLKAGNGALVKCHKCFLAASSSVFAAMLSSDLKESRPNMIDLTETSEEGVQVLLNYIYSSEMESTMFLKESSSVAFELLQAAHKYEIDGLEIAMKKVFLKRNEDWYDVEVAMNLFLFARNVNGYDDLKTKCVKVLKAQKNKILSSDLYKDLFRRAPEAAQDFCSTLLLI